VLEKLRKSPTTCARAGAPATPTATPITNVDVSASASRLSGSREEADRSAELEHEGVQRGREYEERYAAERAAEEAQTESSRDDMGKPE
jgi:hypothetical protein